jgi:hypothetical protein
MAPGLKRSDKTGLIPSYGLGTQTHGPLPWWSAPRRARCCRGDLYRRNGTALRSADSEDLLALVQTVEATADDDPASGGKHVARLDRSRAAPFIPAATGLARGEELEHVAGQ